MRRLLDLRPKWSLGAILVVFGASRAWYFAAGGRISLAALSSPVTSSTDQWQLLDTRLLRHELFRSIWYLHSQPPIYNLAIGLLLHLPAGARSALAQLVGWLLGLALVICVWLFLEELSLRRPWPVVIALLVGLSPAELTYESWFFYALPSATVLALASLCCLKFLRRERSFGWGLGFFGAAAGEVLLNSTYQWLWLVVLGAVVAWAWRGGMRFLLSVALVPLALVGLWQVKDVVQFGTLSTSSWLGMNLEKTTIDQTPPRDLASLRAQGRLDQLSTIPAFSPVSAYVPRFAPAPRTGVSALDEWTKSDGQPNYDNLVYVGISNRYLRDDLTVMVADPGDYASATARAAVLWFEPPDDYPWVASNRRHILTYARVYNAVVLQQWQDDQYAGLDAYYGRYPSPAQVPWLTVAIFGIGVVGGPIALWRRRSDRAYVGTLACLWTTTVYAFAVTSLVELAENNRFAFELGPVPLLLAVLVIAAPRSDQHPAPDQLGGMPVQ